LSTTLNNILDPESGVTILFNIVGNCEQCEQHNIVQSCFHRYCNSLIVFRGGPLEIPGGGVKIPPKKFVQRKMPGKKFVQPLRQRKKIRASKQQSINSLNRLNALKKILQRHETEKKFLPQKCYTPLPGFLMVRPLAV
jgi:hypothetical protein